ncbi:MAG: hypothetical protein LiPW41_349 [Parcubacteria group bacterium LiPW_41]|nr:MAG: hypothetical protein LiPW41_349 [Parcubacteria group bacterium LiPW_41]
MSKKWIVISIIVVFLILLFFVVNKIIKSPIGCEKNEDCKILCGINEKAFCMPGSLATGRSYPTPMCQCLNPNKLY